jgi:hypothetical protein
MKTTKTTINRAAEDRRKTEVSGIRPELRRDVIDRRSGAQHEAGHLTVAESFGLTDISATLWRRGEDEADFTIACQWTGQMQYSAIQLRALSPRHARMIGVAGGVASCLWHALPHRPHVLDFFLDTVDIRDASISESDIRVIGCKKWLFCPKSI